jgi:hypothetical protein
MQSRSTQKRYESKYPPWISTGILSRFGLIMSLLLPDECDRTKNSSEHRESNCKRGGTHPLFFALFNCILFSLNAEVNTGIELFSKIPTGDLVS